MVVGAERDGGRAACFPRIMHRKNARLPPAGETPEASGTGGGTPGTRRGESEGRVGGHCNRRREEVSRAAAKAIAERRRQRQRHRTWPSFNRWARNSSTRRREDPSDTVNIAGRPSSCLCATTVYL